LGPFSVNIHNIQYETESIVDRTLTLQRPNMMMEKRVDVEIQVDPSMLEATLTKLAPKPKNLPSSAIIKKEAPPVGTKFIQVSEKQRIPWFAGCEYQCRFDDCGEMFFYNQDLRSHIKKCHGDPDDYLDQYKVFETKDSNIICKECSLQIKRHFSSVFLHLRDKHDGMALVDYAKKHKMKDYDVPVKVKKAVKIEEKSQPRSGTASPAASRKRKLATPTPSSTPTPPPPPPAEKTETIVVKAVTQEAKKAKIVARPVLTKPPAPNQHAKKPWYFGCEYKCQICGKMFFELNQLLFHTRALHNLTGKPYQRKYQKFETKRAFYPCKLCDSRIKHNKTSIQNHLSSNHNDMKLSSYEEVFHPSLTQMTMNGKGKAAPAASENGGGLENDEKFKVWSRGTCKFKCAICNFMSNGSVDFWKHAKNTHNLDIPTYKSKHDNPCVVMNKITCKSCSKVLRYDYGTLLGHASMKHNMTLIEYYEAYYKNNNNKKQQQQPPLPLPRTSTSQPATVAQTSRGPKPTFVPSRAMAHGVPEGKKRAHIWGWRCHYRCNICNRSFSSRVGTQKHINGTHNLSIPDYIHDHGEYMTRKVQHDCLICMQKILHDPSVIGCHMKMCHSISLEEYFVKYIEGCDDLPEEQPAPPPPPPPPAPPPPGKKNNRGSTSTSSTSKVVASAPIVRSSGSLEHFKWANGCEYICKMCPNYIVQVENTLYFHIKNIHGISIMSYRAQYGSLVKEEKRHQCKLCSSCILWKAGSISVHLKSHSMKLQTYYEQYIKGQPDQYSSNYYNQGSTSTASMMMATTLSQSMYDPKQWMNRCIYECKICLSQYSSKADFKHHLASEHDSEYVGHSSDFGDPMMLMNLHGCLMCQEMITCDAEDISDHLVTAHALSLEDYHDRYMANDRTIATAKKQNSLCRDWDQESAVHECLMCSQQVTFSQHILDKHMNEHGIDLRTYEKRFRYELDVVFETLHELGPRVEIENEIEDDDDDFGSVFEEDDELNEDSAVDPLGPEGPEDIDDIDIEENVNYITDAL
jgi:hypothetical protein